MLSGTVCGGTSVLPQSHPWRSSYPCKHLIWCFQPDSSKNHDALISGYVFQICDPPCDPPSCDPHDACEPHVILPHTRVHSVYYKSTIKGFSLLFKCITQCNQQTQTHKHNAASACSLASGASVPTRPAVTRTQRRKNSYRSCTRKAVHSSASSFTRPSMRNNSSTNAGLFRFLNACSTGPNPAAPAPVLSAPALPWG